MDVVHYSNIFSTTKRVKLIGKKRLAEATFDPEYKAFVVHIATFNISSNIDDKVHLFKKAE